MSFWKLRRIWFHTPHSAFKVFLWQKVGVIQVSIVTLTLSYSHSTDLSNQYTPLRPHRVSVLGPINVILLSAIVAPLDHYNPERRWIRCTSHVSQPTSSLECDSSENTSWPSWRRQGVEARQRRRALVCSGWEQRRCLQGDFGEDHYGWDLEVSESRRSREMGGERGSSLGGRVRRGDHISDQQGR